MREKIGAAGSRTNKVGSATRLGICFGEFQSADPISVNLYHDPQFAENLCSRNHLNKRCEGRAKDTN